VTGIDLWTNAMVPANTGGHHWIAEARAETFVIYICQSCFDEIGVRDLAAALVGRIPAKMLLPCPRRPMSWATYKTLTDTPTEETYRQWRAAAVRLHVPAEP